MRCIWLLLLFNKILQFPVQPGVRFPGFFTANIGTHLQEPAVLMSRNRPYVFWRSSCFSHEESDPAVQVADRIVQHSFLEAMDMVQAGVALVVDSGKLNAV